MSYTQINPNAKGLEDLNMTPDEVNRFSEALKKKEFVDMLGDYMNEISDPKNKAEYDQYLKQLEREGELPKGTQLLHPKEGFCIKSTITSNQNKKSSQKIFVNICTNPQVEKPSSEASKDPTKKGSQWRIPYIAGKVRLDQTNQKEVCSTIEVCFHDEVLIYANTQPAFQKLVCDTAIEAVEKQIKDRDEKVSKDYKVMNNLKCKGGVPATLTVRTQFLQNPKAAQEFEEQKGQRQSSVEGGPKLFREFQEAQNKREKDKKEEEINKNKIETQEEEAPKKSKPLNAPEYKILYSYESNYEDFLEVNKSKRKLPQYITVQIELPNAEGVNNLKLDIRDRLMIFEIPKKHYLEIMLPYEVDQENGDAKYDKKNKKLKVKLPLAKSNFNQQQIEKDKQEEIQKELQIDQSNSDFNEENKEKIEKKQNQEDLKQNQEHNNETQIDDQNNQQSNIQTEKEEINIKDPNSLLEVTQKPSILQIYNPQQENKVQEIQLIQEIIPENIQQQIPEILQQNIEIDSPESLKFTTTETMTHFFFVFHLPNYPQTLEYILRPPHFYLLNLPTGFSNLKVEMGPQSCVKKVVDYIVLEVQKNQECFWNEDEQQKWIQNDDWQQVNNSYLLLKQQIDEEQTSSLEAERKQIEQENNQNQVQQNEEVKQEVQQDDIDNNIESKQVNDPSLNQINKISNALQFIDFKSEFAFLLD